MWIGWLEFDLLLGDVHSLKAEAVGRSVRVIAELRRRFTVSAAETGDQDLHRRAGIGLSRWSPPTAAHVVDVLDAAERLVAARPELELLSVRRGLLRSTDSSPHPLEQSYGDCQSALATQRRRRLPSPAPACAR